ncbi:hypothetical protein BHE74_00034837 [Ensete ventricosum]|nr:hypothetical protein GW17_00040431 [Ensete ventricosum]RWW58308.1 hypothetical protein BHE74_00034837 [Ensete ventricosum]RZS06084.1 hypothetical protein BHM03_00036682 [Ensete ventricosum]
MMNKAGKRMNPTYSQRLFATRLEIKRSKPTLTHISGINQKDNRGERRRVDRGERGGHLSLGRLDAAAREREETLEKRLDDELGGASGVHFRRSRREEWKRIGGRRRAAARPRGANARSPARSFLLGKRVGNRHVKKKDR